MRPQFGRRVLGRRTVLVIGVAALVVPIFVGGASGAPAASRSTLSGSRPSWTPSATVVGTPSASTKVSFNVVLRLRDAAGAAKLAVAVSNPSSSSYGHYVTPAQFNAAYAPTTDQVAQVRSFLSGAGIQVTGVAAGNRWVHAIGTARQVEAAFATTLRTYRYKGHTLREPASLLSVPASLAPMISAVVGVGTEDTLRRPASMPRTGDGPVSPAATSPNATASCSTYWNQHQQTGPAAFGKTSFPTTNCGYSPAQLRSAYGVASSVSSGDIGTGVTVAIIDAYASPTMLTDANAYSAHWGEPQFAPGQYTETTFTPFANQSACGGEAGWNQEESLDVEAVHGMAPGANVHYIGASDCGTGLDDAINFVIQNHAADIVSNSWGGVGEPGSTSEIATEHSMFVQAAAEGIGFYFSTGDDGDNVLLHGLPHPEPDYPSSDDTVTAVGGTSLAVTSSGGYNFETAWGDDVDPVSGSAYQLVLPGTFQFGGGGGVSRLFVQPSYQASTVPSSLAKLNGSTPMRVIPDVAAVADPELGFLIGFQGAFEVIGGTSLACPVIAGLQALASQGRMVPIGFANPELYALGQSSGAFHDVKAPTSTVAIMTPSRSALITLGKDTSLTATTGYDDTTGLGSPSGLNYILGQRLLSSRHLGGFQHAP
jgi:subtilase family serine protease